MTSNVTEAEAARVQGRGSGARASSRASSRASPSVDAPSAAAARSAPVAPRPAATGTASSFFRRHRVALLLAVVAAGLYAGSILYIVYGRGPIA